MFSPVSSFYSEKDIARYKVQLETIFKEFSESERSALINLNITWLQRMTTRLLETQFQSRDDIAITANRAEKEIKNKMEECRKSLSDQPCIRLYNLSKKDFETDAVQNFYKLLHVKLLLCLFEIPHPPSFEFYSASTINDYKKTVEESIKETKGVISYFVQKRLQKKYDGLLNEKLKQYERCKTIEDIYNITNGGRLEKKFSFFGGERIEKTSDLKDFQEPPADYCGKP